MTITTDALLSYRLAPGDRDAVVAAFAKLRAWPGVNPHAVGMVGLSAGDGPISLAAADPRIRDQVRFIALFGGYFNAADLVRDLGERALTFDGHTEAWQPQDVPVAVLANSVTPLLPVADQSAFNEAFANGIVPLSAATLAAFDPTSRAIYHLLAGDDPTNVTANFALLTPPIQQLLRDLSPQTVFPDIHAKVFLLHDRHDLYVPFTESRHFAAALQGAGQNYEFVEFNIFQHVEVKGDLPIGQLLGDGSHLFGLLYEIVLYGA
jgi:acetyl esterase/lipase